MKNLCFTSILVVCFSVISFSQSNSKKIILENGIAKEVTLDSQGEILQVHRTLPNHMSDYSQGNENVTQPYQSDFVSDNSAYNLEFKSNRAVMNNTIVDQLNSIIATLKGSANYVMLRTAYSDKQENGSELAKNRVEACKKYLEIKGIDASRILIAIDTHQFNSDVVEVHLK